MSKLNRVITSTTYHPDYFPYWPLVAEAWRKTCGVVPTLAFVAKPGEHHLVSELSKYGDVHLFQAVDGIPIGNQAKVARLFLASQMGNDLCTINDVDLLPLQGEYVELIMSHYKDGCAVCVGADILAGTEADGKFPMGYFTASGNTFREIANPQRFTFDEFIKSFVGVRVFDSQEDISKTIPVGEMGCFSDESLTRMLMHRWRHPERTIHMARGWSPYNARTICRSTWDKYNPSKLEAGEYVECHLPHPYDRQKIGMLIDFLAKRYGVLVD